MSKEELPVKRAKRPNFSRDFKRRVAQQACEPGVSVAQLAFEHGINANMLFKWRRHLRAGLFDDAGTQPALLPVTVIGSAPVVQQATVQEATMRAATAPARQVAAKSRGVIEIRIRDVIMRIDGEVDAATLRTVLECLRP